MPQSVIKKNAASAAEGMPLSTQICHFEPGDKPGEKPAVRLRHYECTWRRTPCLEFAGVERALLPAAFDFDLRLDETENRARPWKSGAFSAA